MGQEDHVPNSLRTKALSYFRWVIIGSFLVIITGSFFGCSTSCPMKQFMPWHIVIRFFVLREPKVSGSLCYSNFLLQHACLEQLKCSRLLVE
jgi:hypothetical protein